MYELCLLSSLTSSEWASWVQAIGSIAAILGAVGIAVWQSKRQHEASLALLRTEKRISRTESAKALLSLSTGALRLLEHSAKASLTGSLSMTRLKAAGTSTLVNFEL